MRDSGVVLDIEEAERILDPYRDLFVHEIRGAFRDWALLLSKNPVETAGLSHYVQRRYIHDRIVHRLTGVQASGDYPGLRLGAINGLRVAVIDDRLLLKLKRLSRRLRSRNILTEQTKAFDSQAPLLIDPSVGRLTNVTGGYVLDDVTAEPIHIVAVCWEGDHRHWVVELDNSSSQQILELEAEPVSKPEQRRRVRVIRPSDNIELE